MLIVEPTVPQEATNYAAAATTDGEAAATDAAASVEPAASASEPGEAVSHADPAFGLEATSERIVLRPSYRRDRRGRRNAVVVAGPRGTAAATLGAIQRAMRLVHPDMDV